MRRRDFLKSSVKTGAVLAGVSTFAARPAFADIPDHLWEGYNFGCPQVTNRLDQGPFGITQDEGWYTIFVTQPSRNHIRNFGAGFVRSDFLKSSVKTGAVLAGVSTFAARPAFADIPDHLWEGYNFGCPQVTNRLDQGPFGITQDEGWYTIFVTQPSRNHIRNFGAGFVGYTWEENGPAL